MIQLLGEASRPRCSSDGYCPHCRISIPCTTLPSSYLSSLDSCRRSIPDDLKFRSPVHRENRFRGTVINPEFFRCLQSEVARHVNGINHALVLAPPPGYLLDGLLLALDLLEELLPQRDRDLIVLPLCLRCLSQHFHVYLLHYFFHDPHCVTMAGSL